MARFLLNTCELASDSNDGLRGFWPQVPVLTGICGVYVNAIAQQSSHDNKDDFAGVNARGDQGMGSSHEKTTHHFHLLADGGAIEIQSNEPTDTASEEAIPQHLAMIAVKFSQGILPFRCLSMPQTHLA
jgi:hypothetical protein